MLLLLVEGWSVLLAFLPGVQLCEVDQNKGIRGVTEDGASFISCDMSRDHNVFVNSVRSTDGVNQTIVNRSGQLQVSSCTQGTPDVFNYLGNKRTWFCRPGCNPIEGRQWTVTYPREIVSLESSSPPIFASTEHTVLVACADGYAQVFGEQEKLKHTKTQCTTNGWSNKESSLITCQPGCPNLEEYVSNAIVNSTKNFEVGKVPFRTGDAISIFCNRGYTLIGQSPVYCNSLNKWQYTTMPKCVRA